MSQHHDTHLTRKVAAMAVLFTALSVSCADVYAQGVARKVARDFDKIESYQGRVVERGVLASDQSLVSDVVYEKPFRGRIEVVSPEQHAGELFIYDNDRMVMWFPQSLVGIEIVNVATPSKKEIFAHIKRLTREAIRAYAFALRSENRKVAGERASEWRIIPTRRHPYRIRHTSWNHNTYSMPLKMEMQDKNGDEWYAMEFESIEFNKPPEASSFDFEFPENAVVFRWNLADPGISEAAARRKMNFDFRLPTYLPKGHAVDKIIASKHCLPAALVTMDRGATRLSLSQIRHVKGLYAPRGKPIDVGGATGYLSFLGTFSSLTWVVGNTQLTLTGNVSFPELIDIAASVK